MQVNNDEKCRGAGRVHVADQPTALDVAHDVFDRGEGFGLARFEVHGQEDAGHDLVDQHQKRQRTEVIPEVEDTTEVTEKTPSLELNDESVLSYIKNRYDKEINSVDELFAQTKDNDELPEDKSFVIHSTDFDQTFKNLL